MDIRLCPRCGRGEAPPAVRCMACGGALELRDEGWLIGQTLGNYRIERVLGSGGMGVVFGARHQTLLREAAVKVLQPGLGSGETGESGGDAFARRFLREARLLAALDHPGIVGIYDFDVSPFGFPYLVMPLLRGETLRELLARHPQGLAPAWIAAIAQDLSAALGHAHAQGVVHRDLKPENVFLGAEAGQARARLLDFGIAHGGAREALDRTATGMLMGTPLYLAPEQLRGEPVSPATDQYSLALLIVELLSGRALRAGDSLTAIMRRYAQEALPASALPESLPPAQARALLRATDPQPAARFAGIAAFIDALALPPPDRAALADALRPPPDSTTDPALTAPMPAPALATSAPPTTPLPRPARPPAPARKTRRLPRYAALAATLFAALAALALWIARPSSESVPDTAAVAATAAQREPWLRELDATPLPGSLGVLTQVDESLVLRQAGGWTLFDLDSLTAAPGTALARGERLLGADDDGCLWLLHDGLVESLHPVSGQRRQVVAPDPALADAEATRWTMATSGRWLARIDAERFAVFRIADGVARQWIEGDAASDTRIALGDRLAVVASPRAQLAAYDLDTGELRWQVALPAFRAYAVALAEDLGRIALATEEQVQVHSAADGAMQAALPSVANALAWFADGGRLVSASGGRLTLWEWRGERAEAVARLDGGDWLFRASAHLIAGGDGRLRRYAFGHAPAPMDAGVGQVWAAIAHEDHVYFGGSAPPVARLAPGKAPLRRQVHEAGVPDLRIHESRLVSSSDDRTLAVWKLPELELQWRARGHDFFVNQIAIGASLWSASSDGSLRRWRWPELEPAEDVPLRGRIASTLELHALWAAPDDAELIAGTWNGRLLRLLRQDDGWALATAPFEARTGYRLIDLPAVQAVLAIGLNPGRLTIYDRHSGTLNDLPRDGRVWHAAVADDAGDGAWLGGDAALAHLHVSRREDGRFAVRTRPIEASAFKRIGAMALRPATAGAPALLALGNADGQAFFLPPPAWDDEGGTDLSAPARAFSPIP